MLLAITILQCRRVSLPHIFLTEVLPKLKANFPGEVKTALIQHSAKSTVRNTMETSILPPEREDLVFDWTKSGMFPSAEVIRHQELMTNEPAMPSRRLAIEFAFEHNADFHLWIEDDAIVYASGTTWDQEMRGNEVGIFKEKEYINAAYLLTTPSLDEKLIEGFSNSSLWDLNASMYHQTARGKELNLQSPRVEPFISRIAQRPWARLTGEAERINFRKPESILWLKALLIKICPQKRCLIEFDYPEITRAVPQWASA